MAGDLELDAQTFATWEIDYLKVSHSSLSFINHSPENIPISTALGCLGRFSKLTL